MKEIWKDIDGADGLYQVSNLGRVKSLRYDRVRIMKTPPNSSGYYGLTLPINSNRVSFKVHKLVAMAFLGHVPCGYDEVVDHIDNDKSNNKLSNLQLISSRENISKDRVGSSIYTGVHWHKNINRWVANITINKKRIHLGTFKCELAAAYKYNQALKEI